MLSNPSQYSPQGLSQFPGLQAAGLPQLNPGLFGLPGAYNGTAQFGNPQWGPESGQVGQSQQFPFGWSPTNPYLQGHLWQNPVAYNPFLSSGGQAGAHIPAHQIVPVLAQLTQQIAVQSAVAQQIGIAVHQLAHQLALQVLQGHAGAGFGAGQTWSQPFAGSGQPFAGAGHAFGGGGQPYIGGGAQPFGPGAYGGFNPQAQAWGGRSQTIQ
jgi:hypothetical protein